MIRRIGNWLFILLILSLLSPGANAQKRGRVPTEKRIGAAVLELTRTNREMARKLRKILSIPGAFDLRDFGKDRSGRDLSRLFHDEERARQVGNTLRRELGKKELELRVDGKDGKRFMRFESLRRAGRSSLRGTDASDLEIGRKVLQVMRRNQVMVDMGVEKGIPLEGRRDSERGGSELERYLESIGVADFRVVAESFDANAKAYRCVLPHEVTLLRIFGGDAKPIGRYLFCCLEDLADASTAIKMSVSKDARWADASGLATPPGNLLKDLALVKLPAGTEVIVGVVADNFKDPTGESKLGGNTQVFIPEVKDFPYEHYRLAEDNSGSSQVMVRFDGDRLLRFRRSLASSALDEQAR